MTRALLIRFYHLRELNFVTYFTYMYVYTFQNADGVTKIKDFSLVPLRWLVVLNIRYDMEWIWNYISSAHCMVITSLYHQAKSSLHEMH